MNVHMGVWPHTCTVCNKGFSKESTFRSHIQSHLWYYCYFSTNFCYL
jgi:hypothetical protein